MTLRQAGNVTKNSAVLLHAGLNFVISKGKYILELRTKMYNKCIRPLLLCSLYVYALATTHVHVHNNYTQLLIYASKLE